MAASSPANHIECAKRPAAAIERAQALWKIFGHVGAIAISRTSDFEAGKFDVNHVLRRFGQLPEEDAT